MSELPVWVKAFCITTAVFVAMVLETAIVMGIIGGVVWVIIRAVGWIMALQ